MTLRSFVRELDAATERRIELVGQYADKVRDAAGDETLLAQAKAWALENGLRYFGQTPVAERGPEINYPALVEFMREWRGKDEILEFCQSRQTTRKISHVVMHLRRRMGYVVETRTPGGLNKPKLYRVRGGEHEGRENNTKGAQQSTPGGW